MKSDWKTKLAKSLKKIVEAEPDYEAGFDPQALARKIMSILKPPTPARRRGSRKRLSSQGDGG